MANHITFSELHIVGYQLFQDSETFLNDLSEIDSMSVYGGADITAGVTASLTIGLTAGLTAGLTNSLTSSVGL
ncbi:hypothetical protein NIES4103_65840 [Nostoc sp. NIES-4103]|nr:hypothetical protein NIES4103_65840 [Nostoc sp. NIES-4103]